MRESDLYKAKKRFFRGAMVIFQFFEKEVVKEEKIIKKLEDYYSPEEVKEELKRLVEKGYLQKEKGNYYKLTYEGEALLSDLVDIKYRFL